MGEAGGGAGWAGQVASAPVPIPRPATGSAGFQFFPRAFLFPWNSQQATSSLGSDRWGLTKKGPVFCQGAGRGLSWALCGCLAPPSRGIPLLPKSQPSPASFLQKDSELRSLHRAASPCHTHRPSSALPQVSDRPGGGEPGQEKGLGCWGHQTLPTLGQKPPGLSFPAG